MLVDPKQKLRNRYFYNNLLLILSVFVLLCIFTSMCLEINSPSFKRYSLQDGQLFGPIIIKNKPVVYEIKSDFQGYNNSSYISGEVLDEEQEPIFEFGKDAWHESGYDSDGYYSEAERNMTVKLSFTNPGTYYIKFETEDDNLSLYNIVFSRKSGSGIPHLMLGCYSLLLLCIAFVFFNIDWVKEKMVQLNDTLEDMSDD